MRLVPGRDAGHSERPYAPFQTFIRGLADDKTLLPWLEAAIWPVGAAMGTEEAYLAGLLGMVENIRSGATAVIDNQYLHADDRTDEAFVARQRMWVAGSPLPCGLGRPQLPPGLPGDGGSGG